jgi:hypothetical protein
MVAHPPRPNHFPIAQRSEIQRLERLTRKIHLASFRPQSRAVMKTVTESFFAPAPDRPNQQPGQNWQAGWINLLVKHA